MADDDVGCDAFVDDARGGVFADVVCDTCDGER